MTVNCFHIPDLNQFKIKSIISVSFAIDQFLFHQNLSLQLIRVFSNDLIGICCPTLRITATGPAKIAKSSKLGTYEYYKLGPDGREIFKQAPKVSQRDYLYFSKTDKWMVSHIISHEAIKRGVLISIFPT